MRYIFVTVGLLVVVGALALVKFSQISSLIGMGKEAQKMGPPPEAVASSVAKAQSWEGTLSAVGSIASVKGVEVSNDAAGVVSRIRFESGDVVKQGQVLVELDSSVERAQLGSAQTRRDLAQVNANRARALIASKVISQSQVDAAEAEMKTAKSELEAIRAQIARKTVRAPFSGRLGIRAVNVGQFLAPGTTLTVLETVGGVYVDFSLPQQELANIAVGRPVRVTVEGDKELVTGGVIAAVDPTVDNATRTLKLRASVQNKNDKLRTGMFVNVEVIMPGKKTIVTVPATAVIHASYGDSLFVVEDKKPDSPGMAKSPDGRPVKVARQQFIRVGEARGDFVAVTEGVKAGQEIVSSGSFKLRNGSPILVNNSFKPNAQLNPRPENR